MYIRVNSPQNFKNAFEVFWLELQNFLFSFYFKESF